MRLLLPTCSLSTWTINQKNENKGQYRMQIKCTLLEKQDRRQSKY